jgi:hypothetical protein
MNTLDLAKFERETDPNITLRLKALSSTFRQFLVGLIYAYDKIHHSDILKHAKVESNFLSYHLDLLLTAGLVQKNYGPREGSKFAVYQVTPDGKKFLDALGVSEKLRQITMEETELQVFSVAATVSNNQDGNPHKNKGKVGRKLYKSRHFRVRKMSNHRATPRVKVRNRIT